MKKFLSLVMSFVMVLSVSIPMYASANTLEASDGSLSTTEIESLISDTMFDLDLDDGATETYILYKNENGKAVIEEYNEEIMPLLDYTPGDGVLEYAVFHLGFKNWTSTTGDLYYTLTADEFIKTVAGTAYVKNTSVLYTIINGPYYEDSWYHTISGGSRNITRALKDDINVGDEEEVKVGFESVTITTVGGRGGSFSNNSKIVQK